MKAKILTPLRKPFIFIISLTLGLIFSFIGSTSAVCAYRPSNGIAAGAHIETSDIQYFDVSENGHIALNVKTGKNENFLCSAELSQGRINYMAGNELLSGYCGPSSRYEVVLSDDDGIWLHYVIWSENTAAIDSEGILKLSSDEKGVALVGGLDFTELDDPPTREPRMTAFSYNDGVLRFAYSDMYGASFYSIECETGTQTLTGEYIPDEGTYVGGVFSLQDGFMLVLNDGTVLRSDCCGNVIDTLFSGESDSSEYINNAAEMNGKLFVTAGCAKDTIYLLENGELSEAADILPLGDDELSIKQLGAADGKLYMNLGECIAVYDGNAVNKLDTSFEMPFANALFSNLPLISLVFICVGLVFFIIYAVLAKKNLLFKQLLLTVPAMVIICILICRQAGAEILDIYIETQDNAAIAICDICAGHLDTELIGEISQSGECSAEQYNELRDGLLSEIQYNRGYWNDIYDLRLCVPDEDGIGLIIADTRKITVPFTEPETYLDVSMLEEYLADELSDVSIFNEIVSDDSLDIIFPDNSVDKIVAVVPVCDEEDDPCAYLVVSTDDFSLGLMQETIIQIILQSIVPYMIVLVVLIAAICVVLSLRIRYATKTVLKIADGDLSARIKNNSGDELGEICRQMNTMASNLEVVFEEKDKNEQFYYKFVPEKFRELLGKDKITDLALGDAESCEFTVLFCDIRSFSINSEMLTAKENFEFVNVIYGIAGPIIREYGGFVDKYIGDAVMALFESPDSAVQAGIKLYHSVVLDPSTAQKLNVRDINIGIGIHTGMARIGIVGENERLSGTVISDTVNISSRLESLTKTYHTAMLVSKDTIDRMKDPDILNKRYVGMVQVAGVNEVNALYEILDCLGEEEREKRTASKADFREAVRLFHLGRRSEAVEQLKSIQAENRSDTVVDMYCEYIENMSSEDKGNVFRFLKK